MTRLECASTRPGRRTDREEGGCGARSMFLMLDGVCADVLAHFLEWGGSVEMLGQADDGGRLVIQWFCHSFGRFSHDSCL